MKKAAALATIAILLLPAVCFAVRSDTYFIDMPTAEVLPVRTLGINARMFSGGGVLTYFDFSALGRFTIGASEMIEHLIGTNDEDIKPLVPALQLKFRFYDGSDALPALAIGFDNQGFAYDHDEDEYSQKARGLYLVASKEVLIPGLIFNPGLNVEAEGFEFYKLAGFAGASYNIKDVVSLLFEWDAIRGIKESRLNAAVRVYLYNNFSIDFSLRDFNHKAERAGQLKYSVSL
jgi:hypothetical protein